MNKRFKTEKEVEFQRQLEEQEEYYKKHFGGGLYKIFLEQMTKEKARLIFEVKTNDRLTIYQVRLFKKRVELITELMVLYSIKIKKGSRRELQIKKIFDEKTMEIEN